MKNLSGIKNITNKILVIAIVVIAGLSSVAPYNNVSAANISLGGTKDCDANAVVYCGANSVGQLQNKYTNGVSGHNTAKSIHDIYNSFGISASDINNMTPYVVAGNVYRDGTVKVNGNVVATNAVTAGRQNIAGSTKVTNNGTTFYRRPPSVSFVSNPLSAYVVMKNGVFQFAILASCGNPVTGRATPKPTPVPTHKPTPTPTRKPMPTPTPIPHHYACVANACVQVPGAGYNTCTSSATCHVTYPTQPYKPQPTATCTPTPYYSKPVSPWVK